MGIFCVYIVKSSVCLALFYLFYRLLLSRETFHRFNRCALLGVLFLSVLIPCIEVQVQHPADLQQAMYALGQLSAEVASVPTADFSASSVDTSVWLVAGCMLVYLLGGAFFLLRNLYSLYRLRHLFRACRQESLAGYLPGCPARVQLRVYEGELSPFSWLHYIFISRADLQENGREILIHELAHIRLRHSWDLLLADCCIFLQWFNPAAWLLKQELQAIHEYQADETVIHEGVNARQYQLLIIKKAVGTRLYSMANSLNHSSLKKRITMMMKEKSNPWARLKYLYVLPVAAMTLTAFARPEVSSVMNEISSDKVNDLVAFMKEKNVEKADTVAPVYVPAEVAAKLKGAVSGASEEMPEFPDGGTAGLMKYLAANIRYPESAKKAGKQGRVIVQFVVCKDGSITNVSTLRDIDPALDAEAIRVISAMPKWKPGRQKGKEVDVKYTVPVMFRLPDGSQSASSKAADDGNMPLILVDGREYTEELSKLPSSSIAFMKVLLGDEGVAQYGEKARHGVIKVTLKKAGSQSAAQEEVQVKGRVTDPSGQPVIGAVVQILGSKNGTVTDVDGAFQLIAPRDAMLEVAYVGMARAQVKVQPELTVILKEDKKK